MGKTEASVLIDRPVEIVWNFIADLSNAPRRHTSQARTEVQEFQQTSPGSFGMGATIAFKQGSRRIEQRVTTFEPNHKLVYEFIAPTFMKSSTLSFGLETVKGKTRLTEADDAKLTGFYKILGPFVTRVLLRNARARLDAWKNTLESEP